jgi:hypothetical protein
MADRGLNHTMSAVTVRKPQLDVMEGKGFNPVIHLAATTHFSNWAVSAKIIVIFTVTIKLIYSSVHNAYSPL